MTEGKQKKMQQSKEIKNEIWLNGLPEAPMHLIPSESNRSVVSLQVCVELTRPGGHFISLQLMARSIHAFIRKKIHFIKQKLFKLRTCIHLL